MPPQVSCGHHKIEARSTVFSSVNITMEIVIYRTLIGVMLSDRSQALNIGSVVWSLGRGGGEYICNNLPKRLAMIDMNN